MTYPIKLWSNAYSPLPDPNPFAIQVEKSLWEEIIRQEGSRRKFLRIEHPDSLEDWIAPLGQPVTLEDLEQDNTYRNIYLPLWMIDAGHFRGEGEEALLNSLDEEHFPQATKIVLRVIDSAFYNADIKQELEQALSSIGVIRQHTTLQIPVQALGGYAVEVFIAETEPANVVLCEGEEVAVEFQEPIDQIAPPRPPTPIPEPTPFLSTDGIIPEGMLASQPNQRGFRPFQGQGHLVGSSNANIPEWRRDLGPPRRPPPTN